MSKKDAPQVYGMMEISPEHEFDLDFTEIFEQCIVPIIDKNNVVKVVVDRWQSTKIIHDVESYGESIQEEIVGEQYSLRREDFQSGSGLDERAKRVSTISTIGNKLESNIEQLGQLSTLFSISSGFTFFVSDGNGCHYTQRSGERAGVYG